MFLFRKRKSAIDEKTGIRYAGFETRLYASVIDTMLFAVVLTPVFQFLSQPMEPYRLALRQLLGARLTGVISEQEFARQFSDLIVLQGGGEAYLRESFYELAISFSVILLFWFMKSATPGKIFCGIRIVDAKSLLKPEWWQWPLRTFGYFFSVVPFFFGFFWIAWDKKKQGFHDKIARTVVIYDENRWSLKQMFLRAYQWLRMRGK